MNTFEAFNKQPNQPVVIVFDQDDTAFNITAIISIGVIVYCFDLALSIKYGYSIIGSIINSFMV